MEPRIEREFFRRLTINYSHQRINRHHFHARKTLDRVN